MGTTSGLKVTAVQRSSSAASKYYSKEALNEAVKKLFVNDVFLIVNECLSATVYTQVFDVEDEVNGLLTYDRRVCKADDDTFNWINQQLVL